MNAHLYVCLELLMNNHSIYFLTHWWHWLALVVLNYFDKNISVTALRSAIHLVLEVWGCPGKLMIIWKMHFWPVKFTTLGYKSGRSCTPSSHKFCAQILKSGGVFINLLTVVTVFLSRSKCPFQFPNSLSAIQLFLSLNFLPAIKRLGVRKTSQ